MKILGIEASGLTASVALIEDNLLKAEFTINNKLTHSETLLPMLRDMCEISGMDAGNVDAIAVSAGPGSFTGLRIGAATAKGLALSYNKPVISVPTLEAMGLSLSRMTDAVVCPIMDARRAQVYSAAYHGGSSVVEEDARDIHDYLKRLSELYPEIDKEFIFIGDGVPVHEETILNELDGDISFAGAEYNRQRAACVAELGMELYKKWLLENKKTAEEVLGLGADAVTFYSGHVMNSDEFVPDYMRKSQAERENEQGLLEDPGKHSLSKMKLH